MGIDEFWKVVQVAAAEYESGYLVDLKLRAEERMAKEKAMIRANERRYMLDKREEEQRKKEEEKGRENVVILWGTDI